MKKIKLLFLISSTWCLFATASFAEHLDQVSSSCTLTTLDGSPAHNLQDLKGEVVYVDFWASWCPPCIKSFSFLNQIDHDLKDKSLHVIGVNLDEKIKDA